MTDSTGTAGRINQLDSTYTSIAEKKEAPKKKGQIGKDEFLQLLITQLKNQDPMDPMKDEQFAVNLAQFSQLEQLISINGKLGDEQQDMSSLASYLGQQVTLNSQDVEVRNHQGGKVEFDLGSDASLVRVELLDSEQKVVEAKDFGPLTAGRQTVDLTELAAESGQYTVKVTAREVTGATREVKGYVAGVVNGFVPGPDPVLLVNDREVRPADIRAVRTPWAA